MRYRRRGVYAVLVSVLLSLYGCGSTGVEATHVVSACDGSDTSASMTPQCIYSKNKDADFFIFDDIVYLKSEEPEALDVDSLEPAAEDSEIGVIQKTDVSKSFTEFSATKLPVGTKILKSKNKLILLAQVESGNVTKLVPYMAQIEG